MATAAIAEPNAADQGDHNDHGHDHPEWLAHHFDTPDQQFDAGKLGIWLFLAQEVLFFAGLFVAYAVYRMNHPEVFVGASQYLNPTLGALNTVVLLASSLAIAWGVRAAQKNQQELLLWLHVFTLACAGLFMGVKVVEYAYKFDEGLFWAGLYSPKALGETGLHKQLLGPFLWSAVIGGLTSVGGYSMYRMGSGKGAWLAGLGWVLMCYVFASGLSGLLVDSYRQSQQALTADVTQEAEAAEQAAAEATAALAEIADPVELATAKLEAERLSDQAAGSLQAAKIANAGVWSDGFAGGMALFCTLCLTALGGFLLFKFTQCFRGDRQSWGAVSTGLGLCIFGMAMGIVIARGIQAGAAHHDSHDGGHASHSDGHHSDGDHHEGDHSSQAKAADAAHSGEEHADGQHAEEHADAEPAAAAGAAAAPMAAAVQTVPGPSPDDVVAPMEVTQGNFFSIYFAMTGVHAIHIFAGIAVIAWIIGRIARGDFSPEFYGPVEYVGLYWHLVDLVWIYLFPLLYLID
ncbi:MAG: cytochrome c oxidase subunit 3 [Planctomycetota bacterium]